MAGKRARQNEMRVAPPLFSGTNATAANRQGDRSLLANAKFAALAADPKFIPRIF